MKRASNSTDHSHFPLWDWPTRVFHWSLVVLLPLAWWTAEEGQMERHEWVGYTVLVLVLFRLGWGLIGSRHPRCFSPRR